MRAIDEIGHVYDRLTVLERAEVPGARLLHWHCRCQCGRLTIVSGSDLRSGKVLSCGCLRADRNRDRFQDLSSQRFGKLLAIERVREENRGFFWRCLCDCGQETKVKSYALLSNHTQSCGCLVSGGSLVRGLPYSEAHIRDVYRGYRTRAQRHKIAFELTIDQIRELILQPCHYCGTLSSNLQKGSRGSTRITLSYNGLDRRDNKQGYVLDNVVPCCHRCNWAKREAPEKEFLSWLDALVAFRTALPGGLKGNIYVGKKA